MHQRIDFFNPCYPFTSELLESMLDKQLMYFVRSSFIRGMTDNAKASFQISHYHTKGDADRHFQAIPGDRHRFLYEAGYPAEMEKLRVAASQMPGYPVYSKIFIPGIEKKISVLFRENTQRYLRKHTEWDLKGKLVVQPRLYAQLGEIWVRITHQGDTIKFKFEELENS